MKPETLLKLPQGAALCTKKEIDQRAEEWQREYSKIAAEFPESKALCHMLAQRITEAARLLQRPADPQKNTTDHDGRSEETETASPGLDGDFPLGNEEDMAFASPYFSVPELALIQVGLSHTLDGGSFTGYNTDVLVRCGILAEMQGDWHEAVKAYEKVSTSQSVQKREYACRQKRAQIADALYAEAQAHMASGAWSLVYDPLARAAAFACPEAQADLGLAYAYGSFGCTPDLEKALLYLCRSAWAGCGRAAYAVCELYDSGLDIDREMAMEMCKRAAELGEKRAARRYEDGFPSPIFCPNCGSTDVTCMDGSGAVSSYGKGVMIDIAPDMWLCKNCKASFRIEDTE